MSHFCFVVIIPNELLAKRVAAQFRRNLQATVPNGRVFNGKPKSRDGDRGRQKKTRILLATISRRLFSVA